MPKLHAPVLVFAACTPLSRRRRGSIPSAMVANDGPHYSDNVTLFGPGKAPAYRLHRATRV